MTAPGRKELGGLLAQLVQASGLERQEVARRVGVSKATMTRYLAGTSAAKPGVVRRIIAATGQEEHPAATEALRMAGEVPSGNAGRVVIMPSGSATSQRRWREEASKASRIEEWAMTMPCGLLQTERYMRAIFIAGGQTGDELERSVHNRMASQREVLDDGRQQATLLMPEGVFSWTVEGPDLMAEQLEHIAERAARDTGGRIRIGLIRRGAPVSIFPMGNMTIYDARLVVTGNDYGTAFMDQPHGVAWYRRRFAELSERATWNGAAAAEFERIAREYRR